MMFSGLGNEWLGARKIMLKCLCMCGAGWTATPTDVLRVLRHLNCAESSPLETLGLRIWQYLIVFKLMCNHKDQKFLLMYFLPI